MADADIAFLEQKLKRLEGLVQDISSCANTSRQDGAEEGNMDISFSDPLWSTLPTLGRVGSTISIPPDPWRTFGSMRTQSPDSTSTSEDFLETVGSRGQETSARGGEAMTAYRGQTTGIEVFRILRGLCDTFLGLKVDRDNAALKMANALDSTFPTPADSATSVARMSFSSETSIKRWINIAFSEAFILWPFIDRDDLNLHAQRLLEEGHSGRNRSDDDHLGLVHAVIALGQRHDIELTDTRDEKSPASDPAG